MIITGPQGSPSSPTEKNLVNDVHVRSINLQIRLLRGGNPYRNRSSSSSTGIDESDVSWWSSRFHGDVKCWEKRWETRLLQSVVLFRLKRR